MNKEQIEQAAKEFAKLKIEFFGTDGIPTGVNAIKEMIVHGFKEGVDWRINSVWHDMKAEEPQVYGEYENRVYPQIPCLVYGHLSTGIGYGVRHWNITEKCWDDEECDDYECSKDAIEKWAYLDDLLPTKSI